MIKIRFRKDFLGATPRLLDLGTVDVWGWVVLCGEGPSWAL